MASCVHCADNGVVSCTPTACAAADPALPWEAQTRPAPCRPCWIRLGGAARSPRPVPRSSLPCVHLGEATGEESPCDCGARTRLKVFRCAQHGKCTLAKNTGRYPHCNCLQYEPDTYRLVAPRGTRDAANCWEGRSRRKPWGYRVTASIPHLDTLEPLAVVIETLRVQTERPYILVIDTGSPPDVCAELERLRADDLEIHYLKGHAYIQSSGPVSTAMDLSFALCRSEYLYATHSDVFLRRRDYIAWLLGQCSADLPVIGYEMSDRSWATDQWRGIPSHTASLYHMPTMRRHGLVWSMEHGYELAGWVGRNANGWPDTETGFGIQLKQKGVPVRLIGTETNYRLHDDQNLTHVRSYPGIRIYDPGNPYHAQAARNMERALAETRARLRGWSAATYHG